MSDLKHTLNQIMCHCQDAELILLKRDPERLQALIKAKLAVESILKTQIAAIKAETPSNYIDL